MTQEFWYYSSPEVNLMKSIKEKKGQFIIIAVMFTAIMIVSIGALMHGAITYYKHEPWEEYSALIGDVEINSRRVVEFSLANYTNSTQEESILAINLQKWKKDLKEIYPSSGISLTPDLSGGGIESLVWNMPKSTSKASAKFTLDITSIGLEGYNFSIVTSLSLTIRNITNINSTTNEMIAVVESETGMPVTDLTKGNFRIENSTIVYVSPAYSSSNTFEYRIVYDGPLSPHVEVWDQRGIRVVGFKP
ncbi:MAG: hypothetical protein NWE80_03450 [Candidatus Bathyarchaeota archaeon]|nr:hypothetical protein [Candidatus Bathyarchaeota archaeon]